MIQKMQAYLLAAVSAIFLLLLGVQTWQLQDSRLEAAQVKTELAQVRAAAASASAAAEAKHRETEQQLNAVADAARKETDVQVQAIAGQRDALLKRVRVAEAKLAAVTRNLPGPTAVAGTGKAASGDPGAELLGSIGQEDVEEASRAELLRIHLKTCYAQYDRARMSLMKLSGR